MSLDEFMQAAAHYRAEAIRRGAAHSQLANWDSAVLAASQLEHLRIKQTGKTR